jgi:hypothetical protein
MNFFSQCLNYNAQLRTLNTEPVYFHPSLDGSYKKIPPFHSPVNFETHRAERMEHSVKICFKTLLMRLEECFELR